MVECPCLECGHRAVVLNVATNRGGRHRCAPIELILLLAFMPVKFTQSEKLADPLFIAVASVSVSSSLSSPVSSVQQDRADSSHFL